MPEQAKSRSEGRPEAAADGSQSVAVAREDAGSLHDRALTAEQQRDEYLAQLQRTQADSENYKKRVQRDIADERKYAHAPLARELLPALDNLQRALAAAREAGEKNRVVDGVTLVESQLLDALGRFGIVPINPLGQPFDPTIHEAVFQQPRSDMPPDTVAHVLELGYRLHDRLLRPAKVAVAVPS
jgi:molecular chaperone GrpE